MVSYASIQATQKTKETILGQRGRLADPFFRRKLHASLHTFPLYSNHCPLASSAALNCFGDEESLDVLGVSVLESNSTTHSAFACALRGGFTACHRNCLPQVANPSPCDAGFLHTVAGGTQ